MRNIVVVIRGDDHIAAIGELSVVFKVVNVGVYVVSIVGLTVVLLLEELHFYRYRLTFLGIYVCVAAIDVNFCPCGPAFAEKRFNKLHRLFQLYEKELIPMNFE